MIPLYYKGNKYTTQDSAALALHIGKPKLLLLIEKLSEGGVVYLHGSRVFIDEAFLRSRNAETRARIREEYKRNRDLKLRNLMGKDYGKKPLLKKGYITHWLGVYHG
jgi:hypothetical protein